jgi:sporulation protein YlmC with PRC-barrel domain
MAKANESRGLRDEANVGPDPKRTRQLAPMHELKDWKVADGEPDVRGWVVFTSTGREMGVVTDLLVDTESREVVLVDVDLKRNDRHTLAPIRAAWIDRPNSRLVIDSRELESDEMTPSMTRGAPISDAEVRTFSDRYARAYGDRGYESDREYRVRHGDDELRFHRRATDAAVEASPSTPSANEASAAGGALLGASSADLTDAERARRRDADRQIEREVESNADRRMAEQRARETSTERESTRASGAIDEATVERADQEAMNLSEERELDPRELDGRTRIDEGETLPPQGDALISRRRWVDDAPEARDASDASGQRDASSNDVRYRELRDYEHRDNRDNRAAR